MKKKKNNRTDFLETFDMLNIFTVIDFIISSFGNVVFKVSMKPSKTREPTINSMSKQYNISA